MNCNCYGCYIQIILNYMAIQVAVELTVNTLVSTDVTGSTISTELEPINIKNYVFTFKSKMKVHVL